MKQHNLALVHLFAGHQRGAIRQLRNHPVGQSRVRLGHDLRIHRHIGGDGQAKEWRGFGKGIQRFGFTPAHRAAHIPAPGAQADRQKRVLGIAAHVAGGKAWPGKADQQPTRLDPGQDRVGFARGELRHIGQNDHIGVGLDNFGDRPVDQIGVRGQSLVQIMQGRQQNQPLAVSRPRDQRNLAPFQGVIGQ